MRFIPTLVHAAADYLVGIVVMAMPFLFGWTGPVSLLLVLLGAAVILYSALTHYELGLLKLLTMRAHLVLDLLFGLAMLLIAAFSPDLPGRWLVIAIGLLALVFALTTKDQTSDNEPADVVPEQFT